MAYIFDTNIFIRSKNEMPMDVWTTFWSRMKELVNSGRVFSCQAVKDEIERGKDELTEWVKLNAPRSFYLQQDDDVLVKYADAQSWVNASSVFTESAKTEFANVADAYIVATAAAKNMTVVTYETPDPNCKRRVKIPDACNAPGVRCCDLNTALREMGITI